MHFYFEYKFINIGSSQLQRNIVKYQELDSVSVRNKVA